MGNLTNFHICIFLFFLEKKKEKKKKSMCFAQSSAILITHVDESDIIGDVISGASGDVIGGVYSGVPAVTSTAEA